MFHVLIIDLLKYQYCGIDLYLTSNSKLTWRKQNFRNLTKNFSTQNQLQKVEAGDSDDIEEFVVSDHWLRGLPTSVLLGHHLPASTS